MENDRSGIIVNGTFNYNKQRTVQDIELINNKIFEVWVGNRTDRPEVQ